MKCLEKCEDFEAFKATECGSTCFSNLKLGLQSLGCVRCFPSFVFFCFFHIVFSALSTLTPPARTQPTLKSPDQSLILFHKGFLLGMLSMLPWPQGRAFPVSGVLWDVYFIEPKVQSCVCFFSSGRWWAVLPYFCIFYNFLNVLSELVKMMNYCTDMWRGVHELWRSFLPCDWVLFF